MSGYTKGDWVVGVSRIAGWPAYRLRDMENPNDNSEVQANARLIAAAPNLLEACEIGLQIAKWTAQVRNAPKALAKDIETIEAAIAKAKKE